MPVPSDWLAKLEAFVADWYKSPMSEEYLADNPFEKFVLTERPPIPVAFVAVRIVLSIQTLQMLTEDGQIR